MSPSWQVFAHWTCVVVIGGACGALAWWTREDPPEAPARRLRAHVRSLERRLTTLRWPVSGRQMALAQCALVVVGLASGLAFSVAVGAALACLPWLAGPALDGRVNRRLEELEMQLEPWLRALAGGLGSGASLGQALEESIGLVESPLREELQQVCRDLALGTSVGEALRRMAGRVHSATLATAIAAIRIGQRSGGGLPQTLRESAATLREMARLEGVVRTRTAEARAQAAVVGLIPIPMVAFIHHLNPRLMRPLWEHPQGPLVVALALALWVVSIVLARRILDVDI